MLNQVGQLRLKYILKFAVDGQWSLETNPRQGRKNAVEIDHTRSARDNLELDRAVPASRYPAEHDIFDRNNTQLMLDHGGANRKFLTF